MSAVAQERRPDLAGILERKELRVALPRFDAPPFFRAVNGEFEGFDIDIARQIGRELNVKVTFDRSATTFNQVVDIIAAGKADVAISKLSRTLARAQRVIYTRPYISLKHALALNRVRFAEVARGRDAQVVLRDFNGSLGVIAQSSFVDFARRNFPNAKVVEYQDWDSALDAVRFGQVTAVYRDEIEIRRLLLDDPSASLTLRTVTFNDLTDTIGMVVPPSSPHFAAFLDMFITERLGVATAESVLARYQRLLH